MSNTLMGYTQSEAETELALWKAASTSAAAGRSYAIGDRQLTRQDMPEIRKQILFLSRIVDGLSASAAGSNKPAALACFNSSVCSS